MGLEQKLSLRLSQRLVMTPTLQQAIKLLQMTRLELQDVVNQELVSNPVLDEEDPGDGSTPDEEPGAAETREMELASSAEAPDAALEAAVADDREFAAAATDADARAESAEALPAPTSDVTDPGAGGRLVHGRHGRSVLGPRPRGVLRRLHGRHGDGARG